MPTQRLGQHGTEGDAVIANLGHQPVAPNHLLHRQRRCASHRVPQVGVPVLEKPAALGHRLDDAALGQHGANRLVTTAQPLRHRHQVGHHAFLLTSVQRSSAAHPTHHLVQDEQYAVLVAHGAHCLEIARHGRQHPGRGAAHGLGHEGDDAVCALGDDGRFKLSGQAQAVLFGGFIRALFTVWIAGRNVRGGHQDGCKGLTPPGVATHRQRPQRIAVVALAPRNELRALGLTDFHEVLARHLERRLDRL